MLKRKPNKNSFNNDNGLPMYRHTHISSALRAHRHTTAWILKDDGNGSWTENDSSANNFGIGNARACPMLKIEEGMISPFACARALLFLQFHSKMLGTFRLWFEYNFAEWLEHRVATAIGTNIEWYRIWMGNVYVNGQRKRRAVMAHCLFYWRSHTFSHLSPSVHVGKQQQNGLAPPNKLGTERSSAGKRSDNFHRFLFVCLIECLLDVWSPFSGIGGRV